MFLSLDISKNNYRKKLALRYVSNISDQCAPSTA